MFAAVLHPVGFVREGSGPIHLGRRTAEGGCPHMSCGGEYCGLRNYKEI
jgi:hypothetical protein